MADITIQSAVSISHSGMTVGGNEVKEYTLDAAGKKTGVTQTLSTVLADLATGAITWSEATWAWIKNLSGTPGEDVTITKSIGVGSLTKQGDIGGGSVPATAAGGAGFYYEITSAGTSQSKTWAVGEWAIYSGTSGVWFRIQPNVEFAVLKPGDPLGAIRVKADGIPLRAKSATGTPTIQTVMAGPLA